MVSPWSWYYWVETSLICNLRWSACYKWELNNLHWLQKYMCAFRQPRTFTLINFFYVSNAPPPRPQPPHTALCSLYMTHRFLLRLSPCEGLCFSFSLHLSPSESDDSDSEDSLDDDDDDDDDDEDEAEEDESDWTPVGSSMCTLSAISAISALSFC